MTLWKKTSDNSVRYMNKDEQPDIEQVPPVSRERFKESNTRKKNDYNENELSQKNKKNIKNNTTRGGFKLLKWMTNIYF